MNLDLHKVIRGTILCSIFIAFMTLQGISNQRQTHQIVFMLMMMGAFSLILKNIWISSFLLWTIFIYSFFKFSTGSVYLSNIFFGCILYFLTKISFKKENINFYINGFLWFVFANIFYMIFQVCGLDFIFVKQIQHELYVDVLQNDNIDGFMGHKSILATLIALTIPLMATRKSKMSMVAALFLFIPLYICKTSLCFVMGLSGLLFVLFFNIKKKTFVSLICVLFLCGLYYSTKIDRPGVERFSVWHKIMKDVMIHPVTGWGLDSFSNITPNKDFKYSNSTTEILNYKDKSGKIYSNIKHIDWWDNPHNLLISLVFEFGIIGVILFFGYIRQNILRFQSAIKNPNTIGIAGFIVVFLGISMGHFPMWLARETCFIIPFFSLFEVSTT